LPVLTKEELRGKYKIKDLNSLSKQIEEEEFVRQALILTCLSMLLEVFGHVFISLATTMGYLLYYLNKQYLLIAIFVTQFSDVGGYMFGKLFGKDKFARSISPKKTV